MFDEIRICALGSIDEAVLELHSGLTVLSGETGAGKSSIVRAFGLLAGGRADVGHVRSGRSGAAVEARLMLDPQGAVAARVRECGGELEGGSLIVARTVSADGRSRAFVGGRSVPVGVLAEVVGGLLALHGQSSQLQLRNPGAQRAALDRFAGAPVAKPLQEFRLARERWLQVRRELQSLQAEAGERTREIELLRLGLAEVERVSPIAGEDLDLERELGRLSAVDELRCASETARVHLTGDEDARGDDGGALSALGLASRALDAAKSNDPELEALSSRVHEVCVLAGEVAADLASYAAGVDDDPQRLAAAQERRAQLTRLCRPHATGVDGVLAWAADAARRLAALDPGGQRCSELAVEEAAAAEQMLTSARRLSAARRVAAKSLQRRVSSELAALSMSAARLEVELSAFGASGEAADTPSEAAGRLGVDGGDEVELLFAAGEGMPTRPLAKAASGGELSRVVLALEVVLAAGLGPASMVFDEVDAGIGGEAALEVGRRLAVLGRSRQVICVTHLPQVAAFADRHLLVAKSGRGAAVHSGVSVLDQPQRVRELSRMLAGVSDSEMARGHAAELLESAASGTGVGAGSALAGAVSTKASPARRRATVKLTHRPLAAKAS
jgi:DNA repair protein RecN (Recombination protein N)